MPCQLICPNLSCRKVLKVPEEARGKVVRCQYCRTMLRVPAARRAVANAGFGDDANANAANHGYGGGDNPALRAAS